MSRQRTTKDVRADILNSYTSGTKWASDIDELLNEYKDLIEAELNNKIK